MERKDLRNQGIQGQENMDHRIKWLGLMVDYRDLGTCRDPTYFLCIYVMAEQLGVLVGFPRVGAGFLLSLLPTCETLLFLLCYLIMLWFDDMCLVSLQHIIPYLVDAPGALVLFWGELEGGCISGRTEVVDERLDRGLEGETGVGIKYMRSEQKRNQGVQKETHKFDSFKRKKVYQDI